MLKQLIRAALMRPAVMPKLLDKTDTGVVFMLHRFADPANGRSDGHDVSTLRRFLETMRRRRFTILPVDELFKRALADEPLNGAIAFTIDDGYSDQATVGAPLFAEYDCPATTFLTSGFLDRQIWFWWDQVEYVFRETQVTNVHLALDSGAPTELSWANVPERNAVQAQFTNELKRLPNDQKLRAIVELARAAHVEIPAQPPREYAPMTWDDARACEARGMTFGPHTVTHPILARTADSVADFEIGESWRRLSSELSKPAPVFCYPNGRDVDFGPREMNLINASGLIGALASVAGYAPGNDIRDTASRFRVRRFAMPDTLADFMQVATGLESIKARLRSLRS